jgi:hypothetical protein
MSIMDLQYEMDNERARKAASADKAWEIEAVLYNALMNIEKNSYDEYAVARAVTALRERAEIMQRYRKTGHTEK